MPTQEMRALWHPTRAGILEFLSSGPARRSQLTDATGAPYAEVAYHCRALCQSGCIREVNTPESDPEDPLYEAV